VLAFSSFSPKLKALIRRKVRTASEVKFKTNVQRIKTEIEREREKREREQLYWFLPQTGSSPVPLSLPRRVY
jgi:hypothetical protein